MSLAFYVVYGLFIFLALGAVGVVPGVASRLLSTHHASRSLAAAFALAAAGWIWFGWVEKPYGISRAGLILYTGIGAAGFVRGWIVGIRIGSSMRPSRAAHVSIREQRVVARPPATPGRRSTR